MGIVWASIFWLAGIYVGRVIALLPIHWCTLTLVSILASFILRRHARHRNLFLLLMTFTLAGIRARLSIQDLTPENPGFYNDLELQATITGTVSDDPDHKELHTALRVRAARLIIPTLGIARPVEGDVLVYANPHENWAYGDWVRVKGNLETPPQIDTFSYRDYLARKGIYSWMPKASVQKLGEGRGHATMRWIYRLRRQLYLTVGKLFPEPEASLVAGILLGIESDIPADLYEDFSKTGTTHIIAISGFNITLIANLTIALARRIFGSRRGLWIAGAIIAVYTILVGADAAVVRAAVMGGLALVARYWGREALGLASLGASSMVMTMINPTVLWDVGFQLSFAATLGLILYANPLHNWSVKLLSRWFSKAKATQFGALIAEFLLYTLAAQVTTWPLTMFYFRRFTFISFLTNPIILPLQPALMILSGAATLLGAIWMPIGRLLALAAWPFPALTIRIVTALSHFATGGYGMTGASIWLLVCYYTVMLGVTAVVQSMPAENDLRKRLQPLRAVLQKSAAWGLTLTALATSFVWQSVAHWPDGLLHISFYDVGMGEAILIQSPSGERILVNGGPSPSKLMNQLGDDLPLLGRELSSVILAGTRKNQVGGLVDLVNHVEVDSVCIPPVQGSYSFRLLSDEIRSSGIATHEIVAGQRLDIGENAYIEFFESDDAGLSLLVVHENARILIPAGTMPGAVEAAFQDYRVHDVAVLMLADGGHPSANPQSWLAAVNPQLVIISVNGAGDTNRPSSEVLTQLEGRTVLRTDQHGSITIHTDGRILWAETERQFIE